MGPLFKAIIPAALLTEIAALKELVGEAPCGLDGAERELNPAHRGHDHVEELCVETWRGATLDVVGDACGRLLVDHGELHALISAGEVLERAIML